MTDTFTPNIGLDKPSRGSDNDTWDVPVNGNMDIIDTVLAGVSQISVTGLASGTYTLSLQQYQPRNLEISGTSNNTIVLSVPAGVGGTWSVFNNTSGAGTVYWGCNGVNILVRQGYRSLLVCDGGNMQYADTDYANIQASAAQSNAYSYAASQASQAQTNAEAFATTAANNAQSTAEAFATTAANNAQAAAISASETFAQTAANNAQSQAITISETYTRSLYRAGTFSAINGVVTVTFSTPFAASVTPIVVTQWNYANPNVGWVTPGSISNLGFTYTNSNGGPCDYVAYVPN